MKIVFDDRNVKESLYPFAVTRNAADIRIGILTIREKWEKLADLIPGNERPEEETIMSNKIPTRKTALSILKNSGTGDEEGIEHPWDIFQKNDWALRNDFEIITEGRKSMPVPLSNKTISPENIFIEEGAIIEHCIINASSGPVYIGKNAEVMEGCIIRGPFAICEGAVLKMGAKVYGATTIGPYCMAGGEIKNSVMFGYSNKAHDGYLGDSVLGEWCNLGAGTTNSNIKNTAGTVKVWNNKEKNFIEVGLKCGLLMGDYSRSAINTSFNTGTVAGICCNIFGEGFPPKIISDFTWGKERYIFEKVTEDISNWKKLKNRSITEEEINILKTLYNQ